MTGRFAAGDFCDFIMPVGFVGAFSLAPATAREGRELARRSYKLLQDKVLDSFGLFQFRAIRSEQTAALAGEEVLSPRVPPRFMRAGVGGDPRRPRPARLPRSR